MQLYGLIAVGLVKINQDVAVYFSEPNDLLQKLVKQLTQIIQVIQTQNMCVVL